MKSLRSMVEGNGETMAQFAKRTRLSLSRLYEWGAGVVPQRRNRLRLAKALKVTEAQLIAVLRASSEEAAEVGNESRLRAASAS